MTLEDFKYDHPDRDVAAFKRAVANKLIYAVGKDPATASQDDWLHAAAWAVRDQLVERWMSTTRAQYAQKLKRVYYLSMEFLIGRTFTNALLALELQDTVREALADFGVDIELLAERERDAALGNGGLGRLAACFLDSMATLDLPGFGYGINYEFGLFRQTFVNGYQHEKPDHWLDGGSPWIIERDDESVVIPVYGSIQHATVNGVYVPRWTDFKQIIGVPHDMPIVGFGGRTVNVLRLFSARASDQFDIGIFNSGDYIRAVHEKITGESISKVLYPL